MSERKINVLIYEDAEDFQEIVEEAKQKYRSWATRLPKIEERLVANREDFEAIANSSFTENIQLAVVDLSIQEEDLEGIRAIQTLREKREQDKFPIVMFSKVSHKKARESAYLAGATSYVRKPVDRDKLIDTLSDILGYWVELHKDKVHA